MPEFEYLDIISVNLWQMLISLCNLLILFLIIKKFLFKPVQSVFAKRRAEIDEHYKTAEEAEKNALASKEELEEKLSHAEEEAESMIKEATVRADRRSEKIIKEAKEKADVIIRQAQTEAELEHKKAEAGIKREIVTVSAALTEKMLEREINEKDHRVLIDSFIDSIGEENDANE